TEREERTEVLLGEITEELGGEGKQLEGREKEITGAYRALTKQLVREKVLTDGTRIDGRGLRDLRALSAEVEVLPRVHGSALFQRGETQIMGVTTLNMLKMKQQIDALSAVKHKRYIDRYDSPPSSRGGTGRVGAPKRREVGHGMDAEGALIPVLSSRE